VVNLLLTLLKDERCKTKDYPDGNGAIYGGRLKNKYKPVSAPSMVKLRSLGSSH
jgi:hypothetical protein